MTSFLLAIPWVYMAIMGPFFILCWYETLRRHQSFADPAVVLPLVLAVSAFFASFYTVLWPVNGGVLYGLEHFMGAGVLVLGCYWLLGFRLGYQRMDALLLGILAVLAADQLWQLPYDIVNWNSVYNAEVGLSTVAWSFISVPVLLYIVLKANGRIKTDGAAKYALLLAGAMTANDALVLLNGATPRFYEDPYLLILPWFGFFILLFRSSGWRKNAYGGRTVTPEGIKS